MASKIGKKEKKKKNMAWVRFLTSKTTTTTAACKSRWMENTAPTDVFPLELPLANESS